MEEFDVLVLGGGLAGVSAALRTAELGGRVCLVEKGHIGQAGFQRRNALHIEDGIIPSMNWEEYRKVLCLETERYSRLVREKLNAAGVSVVEGEGTLASSTEISVQKSEGEHLLLKGKSVILAYGSDTRFSSTLPREEGVVISIDEIARLSVLPEKVLVVGGGLFGSEAALGLHNRGCKVFLCYEQKELFPQMDEDFNIEIERQFKKKKIKILPGKKLISIYKNEDALEITLETGIKFSVHQIIIAGERSGLKENEVAEKLGIRLGEHQNILVDDSMLTSLPGVYAVGSVTGELTSDTLSQEEGKVAAENSMAKKKQLNREWVPQIARLSPDVAYVGCSMKTAPHQGFHPVEGVFEQDLNGPEDLPFPKTVGKYKIVADKRSRLVVGIQVISNQTADWFPILLLLIKKGVTVGNLVNCTRSEGAKINALCEAARNCSQALKSP
ncbi:MAG: NAD(P)/FAD-dependent oxidoreductase [Nitrospinae bacterium]|nr:NAD(P)/FAD-dependent oxidoreductase [Nitrospinota bacterium]MBL7019942.1 NAD(P)/FAD-dependent oxidoreductase [Nitrospinaceae bacterium]